jgi:hypothetical protein
MKRLRGGHLFEGFLKREVNMLLTFQKENKPKLANMFTIYFSSKLKGVSLPYANGLWEIWFPDYFALWNICEE